MDADVTLQWETGVQEELIANGGFESGTAGWVGAVGANAKFETAATPAPAEGARFGQIRVDRPGTFMDLFVFQSVTLPTYPQATRLRWQDFTQGGGLGRGNYTVVVTSGTPARRDSLYSSVAGVNDSADPWNPHEADLSAYRGSRITIEFGLTNRFAEPMLLRLDEVQVEVTPTSPTFDVYLGMSPTLAVSDRVYSGPSMSMDLRGLRRGRSYYWRVDQRAGTSKVSSPVQTFMTAPETVPESPTLSGIRISDTDFAIEFPTESGRGYRVQSSTDPSANDWADAVSPTSGTGQPARIVLPLGSQDFVFFRVVVE